MLPEDKAGVLAEVYIFSRKSSSTLEREMNTQATQSFEKCLEFCPLQLKSTVRATEPLTQRAPFTKSEFYNHGLCLENWIFLFKLNPESMIHFPSSLPYRRSQSYF